MLSYRGWRWRCEIEQRKSLRPKRLRGFKRGKVGPKDGKDHIGGNYAAAVNVEMNLPKTLPEATNLDVGILRWVMYGVDYDNSIQDSDKLRSSTGIVANYSSPIGPFRSFFLKHLQSINWWNRKLEFSIRNNILKWKKYLFY